MDLPNFTPILQMIQKFISLLGALVILSGILISLYKYILLYFSVSKEKQGITLNTIRLNLARTLILGLEFIVAADLIGTTTTPDYYALGILASIVLIRTALSFSLNHELQALKKEI